MNVKDETIEVNNGEGATTVVVSREGKPSADESASTSSSENENIDTTNTPASSETDGALAVDPGMQCGLKNLYSGKEDKRGRYHWVDTIPEDLGGPVENAQTAKWALIVRYVKVYNDPRRVLRMHSIVVQSPLLKTLLSKVLKDYPGVTTSLQRLQFSGKFEPLIHRWGEFQKAIEEESDPTTKEHAQLLNDVLTQEFKETIEESMDMRRNRVISYDLLWTLFQPGDIIFSRRDGQDCAFKLTNGQYGTYNQKPVFWLNCEYVDWDGKMHGTQKLNLSIPQYLGTSPIARLPSMPLSFHKSADDLRTRLIERGGEVEKLSGSHYKAYHGVGWVKGQWGNKEKYNIKGRVVIDTACWNRFKPNQHIYVTSFSKSGGSGKTYTTEADDPDQDAEKEQDEEEEDDNWSEASDDGEMPRDGFFPDDDDENFKLPALTTEQKLICTPLLRGYSLATKQWLNFFVNCVHEITFNTHAFDRLVLPANQKELVLGFTETQRLTKKSGLDDVIEGKGKGIILLLSGPPGVGKTLTAESVAEEMRVPLYMMSAGDLGLDSRTVENRLTDVLEMCTKWNAVLLIDEADVFLEQRSLHELERNKLVSIFLRVLEYYEGIMFLTTNRVQTFDAAFQSRIHISLEYPDLSPESRKTVWRNFLKARSGVTMKSPNSTVSTDTSKEDEERNDRTRIINNTITDSQLDRLASMELNGRQIKNVLKTATLLASRREEKLSYEHVKTVLDVTQHLHNLTKETDRQRSAIFC